MSRVSFFTMLLDDNMSVWERNAINAAHDHADDVAAAARSDSDTLREAIGSMQRTIATQDKQIKLLNAAIGVLASVLRDNQVIDGELLDARLEATIGKVDDDIKATAAATLRCPGCKRSVPKEQGVKTSLGTLCASCASALG
ncbi:MAG: hypothetical protein NT062_03850 [Proteobacteria bacterium]|nr:hypothetical protein [Pseudomonadota bacterium]